MKIAKVFMHGNSQAVRLPKEFRLSETEVSIRKAGDAIVLTPRRSAGWKNVRAAIAMFRGPIDRQQSNRFDTRKTWAR